MERQSEAEEEEEEENGDAAVFHFNSVQTKVATAAIFQQHKKR